MKTIAETIRCNLTIDVMHSVEIEKINSDSGIKILTIQKLPGVRPYLESLPIKFAKTSVFVSNVLVYFSIVKKKYYDT